MTPRAQELWSYLLGLAPMGEPIALNRSVIEADLGLKRVNLSLRLGELIATGVIHRVGVSLVEVRVRLGATHDHKASHTRKRLIPYAGAAA